MNARLGQFTPTETAPRTYPIWDWVGPRAGLDGGKENKSNADGPVYLNLWASV